MAKRCSWPREKCQNRLDKKLEDALDRLKIAERRLHLIEEAFDSGNSEAEALSEIGDHLPRDEANEHGTWYFSYDEAFMD
jgi:hypothetical protein